MSAGPSAPPMPASPTPAALPRGRARRGGWPLRDGDLPAERLRRSTLEFADIGENVVYRALLMRQHQRDRWLRWHPAARGFLLAIALFILTLIVTGFLPLILILLAVSRRRIASLAAGLRLPESLAGDLVDLPVAPRDWTIALWGFATTPMGRSAAPYVALFYLGGAATLVGLFALAINSFPAELVAIVTGLGGFGAGILLSLIRPPAETFLPALAGRMRQTRRLLLQRGHPLAAILWALFVGGSAFAGIALATFLLTVTLGPLLALPPVTEAVAALGSALARWLAQPVAPWLNLLLGAAISAALLMAWRRRVLRRRALYLERIDDEITRILADERARRDPGEPSGRS